MRQGRAEKGRPPLPCKCVCLNSWVLHQSPPVCGVWEALTAPGLWAGGGVGISGQHSPLVSDYGEGSLWLQPFQPPTKQLEGHEGSFLVPLALNYITPGFNSREGKEGSLLSSWQRSSYGSWILVSWACSRARGPFWNESPWFRDALLFCSVLVVNPSCSSSLGKLGPRTREGEWQPARTKWPFPGDFA